MTAFDAKRAGDVASRNMAKMGIDWVTFEGKQIALQAGRARRALSADRGGNTGKSAAESGRQARAACDWRSGAEAGSSSGKRCASRLAVLRNPDEDSR